MALVAANLWEFNGSATANAVGGGFFNPTNAGMLTDGTCTLATSAAPVFASASYNFVAGDVGHWLYIKSNAAVTVAPGWYKIASLSGVTAVLSCAIGSASVNQATEPNTGVTTAVSGLAVSWRYGTNTVIGCASTASPTVITFAIDYSRGTAGPIAAVADFNAVGASVTLTSATAAFTPVMVGNGFHQTTTGTGAFGVVGWYEIATYVNATTVTLDRTPNSGTASVNTTGYVGGAIKLGSASIDTTVLTAWIAGNYGWMINSGTHTLVAALTAGTAGTGTAIMRLDGYATNRGDAPTGSTRPAIDASSLGITTGTYWICRYLSIIGSSSNVVNLGTDSAFEACKVLNLSTTAARRAILGGSNSRCVFTELVSLRGIAMDIGSNNTSVDSCYMHSSDIGFRSTGSSTITLDMKNSVSACNVTAAVSLTAAITGVYSFVKNTFYGAVNKLGLGFSFATGVVRPVIRNNIIYGFVTGVTHADTNTGGRDNFNDYFNNTNDVSATGQWQKGQSCIAADPLFSTAVQVTGTGATSSSGTFTDATKNFTTLGFTTDDYIQFVTATTATVGMYQITAVGTTTLTLFPAPGTGSNIVWQATITRGGFAVTGSSPVKGVGFP